MKCLLFNVVTTRYGLAGRTLGVYKIAHLLRTHGWDVEVIDYAAHWSLEELKELVISRQYPHKMKFFGFSKLFDSWPDKLEEFAGWLKKNYPEAYIISGSQYHKGYPSNYIDYYVTGYGENAIVELLKYLFSNGPGPMLSLQSNSKRKIIDANTFYPATYDTDLTVLYEDRDFIEPGEFLSIEFSRGCKFACSFCDFPFLNIKGDPSRSQESFEREVKDVYNRFGVNKFLVADSTFNDRTEKISKFADVVERLNFDPYFIGYIRADLLIARPKDREELLRMNFLGQFYGIESFNYESTKSIGKGMHPDKIKAGLLDVKNYFQSRGTRQYNGQISLIAGLPFETPETFQDALNWIKDYWIPQPFCLSPLMILLDEKKTSAISKDFKKYNYESIGNLDKDIVEEVATILRDVGDYLLWKNDHMDILQAYNLCKAFGGNELLTHPTTFSLSDVQFNRVDLFTTMNSLQGNPPFDSQEEDAMFLRNYINKKLSIK